MFLELARLHAVQGRFLAVDLSSSRCSTISASHAASASSFAAAVVLEPLAVLTFGGFVTGTLFDLGTGTAAVSAAIACTWTEATEAYKQRQQKTDIDGVR